MICPVSSAQFIFKIKSSGSLTLRTTVQKSRKIRQDLAAVRSLRAAGSCRRQCWWQDPADFANPSLWYGCRGTGTAAGCRHTGFVCRVLFAFFGLIFRSNCFRSPVQKISNGRKTRCWTGCWLWLQCCRSLLSGTLSAETRGERFLPQ